MINTATIIGRLCANPELKTAGTSSVCTFTVACDRGYKNKDGNYETDFIPVTAWRGEAEFVSRHFQKGNMIGVTGRLQSRKYIDKEGKSRSVIELVSSVVSFVGSKEKTSVEVEKPVQEEIDPDGSSDLPF